jgi:ubiquinone biosynthesis protein UbiJ
MLVIESIINQYLALDPEAKEKLAAFDGKVICMQFRGTSKKLFFFPETHGLRVTTRYDGQADATITGSPLSLFKMSLVPDAASLLLKGEVEIQGDTRLGHRFKKVFSEMDIDWSGPLSKVLGENLAYPVHQMVKRFFNWGNQAANNFSLSLGEYLQEESRDIVGETELAVFNREVDKLRDDTSRLEAKLAALLRDKNK